MRLIFKIRERRLQMNKLREELTPLPKQMIALPVDERGYPVPFFVAYVDGKPDFRIIDPKKLTLVIRKRLCWVCGNELMQNYSFVAGPMCGINRTSSEPPSHLACAEWSAVNCPFLSRPNMVRRENNLPENYKEPSGISIPRNPGVAMVWSTRHFRILEVYNGILFKMGNPERISFYCSGRKATMDELVHSVDTGLPSLMTIAIEDGPDAVAQLHTQTQVFWKMVKEERFI